MVRCGREKLAVISSFFNWLVLFTVGLEHGSPEVLCTVYKPHRFQSTHLRIGGRGCCLPPWAWVGIVLIAESLLCWVGYR